MVFIRTKRSKNFRYATLVKSIYSKRKKKKVEKTIKNLGRIIEFPKSERLDDKDNSLIFCSFFKISSLDSFIKNTDYKEIIKKIIIFELYRFGFSKLKDADKKKTESSFSKQISDQEIIVDVDNKKVNITGSKNEITLGLNDGFLHNYTMKKIFNFNPEKYNEDTLPVAFASVFVDAGISIERELFVKLYQKIVS